MSDFFNDLFACGDESPVIMLTDQRETSELANLILPTFYNVPGPNLYKITSPLTLLNVWKLADKWGMHALEQTVITILEDRLSKNSVDKWAALEIFEFASQLYSCASILTAAAPHAVSGLKYSSRGVVRMLRPSEGAASRQVHYRLEHTAILLNESLKRR